MLKDSLIRQLPLIWCLQCQGKVVLGSDCVFRTTYVAYWQTRGSRQVMTACLSASHGTDSVPNRKHVVHISETAANAVVKKPGSMVLDTSSAKTVCHIYCCSVAATVGLNIWTHTQSNHVLRSAQCVRNRSSNSSLTAADKGSRLGA